MVAELGATDAHPERPRNPVSTSNTTTAAGPTPRASQHDVPLLAALIKARSAAGRRAATPGHAGGGAAAIDVRQALGRDAFAADVPMDDDLFRRAREQAEHLAADAWGVRRAFLVPSSAGILGWCAAHLREEDHVIVARDAHPDIRAGMAVSGARPHWIRPREHPDLGLPLGIDSSDLDEALDERPQSRYVLLSSPGFAGTCTDIAQAVQITHRHRAQILVHQAWGAHLAFHPDLPADAMSAGADAVVVNLDHNASALSGGALLLVNDSTDIARLDSVLRCIQAGPPPLAVLASTDAARRDLACASREQLDGLIAVSHWVARQIRLIPGLHVPTVEETGLPTHRIDPTKIVVDVSRMRATGWDMAGLLREKGITPDGADARYVYLMLGATESSALTTAGALVAALLDISWLLGTTRAQDALALHGLLDQTPAEGAVTGQPGPLGLGPTEPLSLVAQAPLTPRQVLQSPYRQVDSSAAGGLIAAEAVAEPPPAIPILMPGEVITPRALRELGSVLLTGARLHHCSDPTGATLQVIDP